MAGEKSFLWESGKGSKSEAWQGQATARVGLFDGFLRPTHRPAGCSCFGYPYLWAGQAGQIPYVSSHEAADSSRNIDGECELRVTSLLGKQWTLGPIGA